MKNKKTIMAFSALFILIFHLWINVTNSVVEIFLKQLCVIGVDLFFFVSAYSISKKDNINYKKFISNRFNNIYFKFVVLAIICALYSSWDFIKFIKTIIGIDLFISGGGAFLWFLPGIMIIYLLIPLYKKIDDKNPLITPIFVIIIYLILSIVISLFTDYTSIFILTNRIPIILLGYYIAKYNIIEYLNRNNLKYFIVTILLLIIGLIVSYITIVQKIKFEWFHDILYILNIQIELGIILLLDKINSNKIINILGSCTLELYGVQMIFGYSLADKIYSLINNTLIYNVCIIISLIVFAIILKYIFDLKDKVIKNEN